MTSPISPVTNQSQGSAAASSPGMAGLLDPTTFLSLLVDELKYQNPLDPTSSSDFMSQIAQLSQVEQLQGEVKTLRAERDHVRQRVERLLSQLDSLEI